MKSYEVEENRMGRKERDMGKGEERERQIEGKREEKKEKVRVNERERGRHREGSRDGNRDGNREGNREGAGRERAGRTGMRRGDRWQGWERKVEGSECRDGNSEGIITY